MSKENSYYQPVINQPRNSFLKKISEKIFKGIVVNNNGDSTVERDTYTKFDKVIPEHFYSFFGKEATQVREAVSSVIQTAVQNSFVKIFYNDSQLIHTLRVYPEKSVRYRMQIPGYTKMIASDNYNEDLLSFECGVHKEKFDFEKEVTKLQNIILQMTSESTKDYIDIIVGYIHTKPSEFTGEPSIDLDDMYYIIEFILFQD